MNDASGLSRLPSFLSVLDSLSSGDSTEDTATSDIAVGEANKIVVTERLCGHLRALIPNYSVSGSVHLLILFDVYNRTDDPVEWHARSTRVIDATGNTFAGSSAARRDVSAGSLFEQWWAEPEIPPHAGRRAIANCMFPNDRSVQRIHFHNDVMWDIELEPEDIHQLTTTVEEFETAGADRFFDWESVDFDQFDTSQQEPPASANSSADTDGAAASLGSESTAQPETTFDDIGGLSEQIRDLKEAVHEPLANPERLATIGISPPAGVLLHGPPGTGKTMLAKAVANETDAAFLSIAGPELAQRYVGEGAKIVRETFESARSHDRAIVFIDEIDAIASTRREDDSGGAEGVRRTMMQLLVEMDGFENLSAVSILAATNRIDRLDEAILRPGRFDRIIEVPKPNRIGREAIFTEHLTQLNTGDIDIGALSDRAEDLTGAHIASVCTEAGYLALRDGRDKVTQIDLLSALQKVKSNADLTVSPA